MVKRKEVLQREVYELFDQGVPLAKIARLTGTKYSFVYGLLRGKRLPEGEYRLRVLGAHFMSVEEYSATWPEVRRFG